MIVLHKTHRKWVTVPQGRRIVLLASAQDETTGEVREDVLGWRRPFKAGDTATTIVVPWEVW